MAQGEQPVGVEVTDPDWSDDEAGERAASFSKASVIQRLMNMGCIFIKNLTGSPILVYTRSKPIRVIDSVKMKIGVDLSTSAQLGIGVVMKELHDPTTSIVPVDPKQAGGRSERIPVVGTTYVSIRRYTPGDDEKESQWLWDCVEQPVKPGAKLTIKGTACPLKDHLPGVMGTAAARKG